MTDHVYDWQHERDHAIGLFNGDTPSAELETTILHHFQQHPGRVHQLITAIGQRVHDGKIRSGWAVLHTELTRPIPTVRVVDDTERETQALLIEHWITHAGGYIDLETELLDEVFGHHGRLYRWRDNPQLRQRVLDHWRQHRPRFQHAEHDTEQRLRDQRELRERLRAATTASDPDSAADHVDRVQRVIDHARNGTPLNLDEEPTVPRVRDEEPVIP